MRAARVGMELDLRFGEGVLHLHSEAFMGSWFFNVLDIHHQSQRPKHRCPGEPF